MFSKLQEISRKLEEYVTLILSSLISSIRYHRRSLNSADIRQIVIIKLDHIGDIILSIPAVANLRAHFPQAHITMVVGSASGYRCGVYPRLPFVALDPKAPPIDGR